MSLTGRPLLVLSTLCLLGALAATIWYWQRGGRWQVPMRTTGILLSEALLLWTGGLVANHALGDLFPSWSALLGQEERVAPPPTIVADPATRLDVWLHARALEGAHHGLVFEWKPAGAASWHLPVAPVIYVPPRYFTAPGLRFPVVLVVAPTAAGPGQSGWDPHKINLLVPRADSDGTPAILVFLRADRPDEQLLTQTLPGRLDGDLRVSARGWALIGVGTDGGVGPVGLTRAPLRFWSAVQVPEDGRPVPHVSGGLPAYLDWQASWTVPGSTPAPGRLPAALRWAYGRLPAPLAAPLTGPPGAAPLTVLR